MGFAPPPPAGRPTPVGAATTAWSASARSRPPEKRSSGRFSRRRRTMRSSAGGSPGLRSAAPGVLLEDRCERRHRRLRRNGSSAPAARRGRRRTRRGPSARRPACLHLLRGHVHGGPETTPGLVVCGSPLPSLPARAGRVSLARPKSRIFTRPSVVRKRFSGLRSRWTIPLRCAAARPCAVCTAPADDLALRRRAPTRAPRAASRPREAP